MTIQSSIEFPERINDNWLSRVMEHFKLNWWKVALIWAACSLLRNVALASAFGTLWSSGSNVGLTHNPNALFDDCILHPMLLAYFCWIQTNGLSVFQSLLNNGVIKAEGKTCEQIVTCIRRLRSPWAARAALLFAVLMVANWYRGTYTLPSAGVYLYWIAADPWMGILDAPALFVVAYAIAMLAWDSAIIVFYLNRVFNNGDIQVDVLNSDRAGGLGAIGGLSGDFSYLIAAIGISISIAAIMSQGQIAGDLRSIPAVIAYAVLAPFVFFAPVWTAHKKMVKYRDDRLQGLAVESREAFRKLQSVTDASYEHIYPQEEIEQAFNKAKLNLEIRQLVMQFPIWPFNGTNLRKFFGIVYATLVPALISFALDKIK